MLKVDSFGISSYPSVHPGEQQEQALSKRARRKVREVTYFCVEFFVMYPYIVLTHLNFELNMHAHIFFRI